MQRFARKPTPPIEAVQLTRDNLAADRIPPDVVVFGNSTPGHQLSARVTTAQGQTVTLYEGEWIVAERDAAGARVPGRFYPIDERIFAATYVPIAGGP
jgi:hypothetical protein